MIAVVTLDGLSSGIKVWRFGSMYEDKALF